MQNIFGGLKNSLTDIWKNCLFAIYIIIYIYRFIYIILRMFMYISYIILNFYHFGYKNLYQITKTNNLNKQKKRIIIILKIRINHILHNTPKNPTFVNWLPTMFFAKSEKPARYTCYTYEKISFFLVEFSLFSKWLECNETQFHLFNYFILLLSSERG